MFHFVLDIAQQIDCMRISWQGMVKLLVKQLHSDMALSLTHPSSTTSLKENEPMTLLIPDGGASHATSFQRKTRECSDAE